MGPFSPGSVSTKLVTVGVASANIAVTPGRQVVLKAANNNSDHIHVEFGSTNAVVAVVPVAGGAQGGFTLGPGDMVELTVPSGQNSVISPLIGNYIAYISLTAAQRLFISEGADV